MRGQFESSRAGESAETAESGFSIASSRRFAFSRDFPHNRAMPRKSRRKKSTGPAANTMRAATTYWDATREPIYCLAFLFPLVLAYEFGSVLLRPALAPEQQLFAQSLVERALAWFGAVGFWVPGLVLLAILVGWQVLGGGRWQIRAWIPVLMLVECCVLTLPLLVLDRLATLEIVSPLSQELKLNLVLALGAAIYEELIFRFLLMTGVAWLITHGMQMPRSTAMIFAGAASGLLFAICHFEPIGSVSFSWMSLAFYGISGVYLATLFAQRGLGICAGCHAAYNLAIVLGPALHR